jgi:hypothetical protein
MRTDTNRLPLETVTLNLVATLFTATQFGWLLETARVEVRKI